VIHFPFQLASLPSTGGRVEARGIVLQAGVPGFGVVAAYAGQYFSMVVAAEWGEPAG